MNDNFEAVKELNGWSKEGEEHALVVQKPQFKKAFKGKCVANMAIKQLLVMKEIQTNKKKNSGSIFWLTEQDSKIFVCKSNSYGKGLPHGHGNTE